MTKYSLFFFIVILIQGTAYADSTLVKKIDDLEVSIKHKYAPDKRTALFESTTDLVQQSIYVETTEKEALYEFKRSLTEENILLHVNSNLLPAADLNGKIYAVANLSVSNNRSVPGHSSELATQMLLGTPVEVLKKDRDYYLIRTPDKYLSWTDPGGIRLMDEKEFKLWKSSEKIVFTQDFGYSYKTSAETATRVSDLVKGNILKLIGKEGAFYKVAYPDNRIAFIPIKNAENFKKWVKRPNPSAQQILNSAKSMIGIPYLWGGTSTKGVDCSGFTKTSFFLNGIILPRDASQQALIGQSVDILDADTVSLEKSLKNLQPGDLLFFAAGTNAKRPNARVTHTAIYIGNGEFIQAAGLVRINSMLPGSLNYDDFQTRTLVSARRMLTVIGNPEITKVENHPWYISN
ncbi:MAG TPA: SH3 domain-containing C40 family peptidase [Sphingobacteriaceae bacterium]|nr:SH3 domain-containing C40 family peptidase [Sphingobacteriaceae bacterium]